MAMLARIVLCSFVALQSASAFRVQQKRGTRQGEVVTVKEVASTKSCGSLAETTRQVVNQAVREHLREKSPLDVSLHAGQYDMNLLGCSAGLEMDASMLLSGFAGAQIESMDCDENGDGSVTFGGRLSFGQRVLASGTMHSNWSRCGLDSHDETAARMGVVTADAGVGVVIRMEKTSTPSIWKIAEINELAVEVGQLDNFTCGLSGVPDYTGSKFEQWCTSIISWLAEKIANHLDVEHTARIFQSLIDRQVEEHGGAQLSQVATSDAHDAPKAQSRTESSGGEGTGVGGLYTYGCPHVSSPALTNPQRADGCFDGYRVVNEDYGPINTRDMVTMLLNPTRYEHVRQKTVKLIEPDFFGLIKHDPLVYGCGWEETNFYIPNLLEHPWWDYAWRAEEVSEAQVPGLKTVSDLTVFDSYNKNSTKVANNVRALGWGLVDSAIIGSGFLILGTEPSHLIQDPVSLRCILTFEGSDDVVDFIEDVRVIRTSFCGLAQKVHSGFKSVVMEMVGSYAFQTKIRPQLPFCNKVDVMGHSLGGATASLFAACASNPLQPGDEGYEEYQMFGWTPATPKNVIQW